MSMSPTRPTPTSNLSEAARAATAKVNVALPATVVSYDHHRQTVTVQLVPAFRRRDPAQGDQVVTYRPPTIPNVPVAFPGSGDWSITWPIEVGDAGVVIVCDRSIDEWKSTAARTTTPQDQRRHDLTDAVFLPGGRSPAGAIADAGVDAAALVVRGTDIKLGSSAASKAIALAPDVAINQATLAAALQSAASAASAAAVPTDGGKVAFATFASTLSAALALWPANQASSTTKAV